MWTTTLAASGIISLDLCLYVYCVYTFEANDVFIDFSVRRNTIRYDKLYFIFVRLTGNQVNLPHGGKTEGVGLNEED